MRWVEAVLWAGLLAAGDRVRAAEPPAPRTAAFDPLIELAQPSPAREPAASPYLTYDPPLVEGPPPSEDFYAPGACPPEPCPPGMWPNVFYWGHRLCDGLPPIIPDEPPPPGAGGPLQQARLWSTWLPAGGGNGFGVVDVETRASFAMPLFSYSSPLVLTPGFGAHWFEGPDAGPDVPPQVYDVYFDLMWRKPLGQFLSVDMAITPGWFGEFSSSDTDGFRLGGRVVATYTWSPSIDLVAGAAYLDRFDTPAIPVGGVIWSPTPDMRWEVLFPRGKLAQRVSAVRDQEWWAYFAVEFGGGAWSIERTSGAADDLAYRDWRLLLGLERSQVDGPLARVEFGWVFNRTLEYDSGTPDFDPDATLLLRGELGF
jgi:hypothetical protein